MTNCLLPKIALVTLLLLTVCCSTSSQVAGVELLITPVYGEKTLTLTDSSFVNGDANGLQIDVLKFYVSKIELRYQGKVVAREHNSYHLVDAASDKPMTVLLNRSHSEYDELALCLGIDSTTSVSGAMGGDLDPTKGMYWTWQSGYINFKLEGRSSACRTKTNNFTFHLGGYQFPFNVLQRLSFPVDNSNHIVLELNVLQVLQNINLSEHNRIMSPTNKAVMLSNIIAKSFEVKTQ